MEKERGTANRGPWGTPGEAVESPEAVGERTPQMNTVDGALALQERAFWNVRRLRSSLLKFHPLCGGDTFPFYK